MFDCLKEAAERAPTKPAFNGLNYHELDQLADEMARILENAKIRPGDRIAFTHRPTHEVAALFFAAWRIGASICPLSLRLPPSQIESHLTRLHARAYIDSFPLAPRIRDSSFPLSFPAVLLFTSGSTALPKIAVLSLSNLLYNAIPVIQHLNLNSAHRWLLNLPLYHVGGIGILLRCVKAQASIALDPNDLEITHISAVPTQLYRATPIYKNLQCLLIGGAPISSYPDRLPCYLSYGLTEMGSLVTMRRNPEGTAPFHLGRPLPEREVRLSLSNEIEVRGNCLFQGYWEEGRIVQPLNQDGWFATGDIGKMSEGGLAILGRKDWQFISGGENIQPEEIEQQLLSLPGVLEAIVIPVDDPEFGRRPAAVLRTATNFKSDSSYLKAALLERLPKYKIPIQFYFVDELPKTGLKINRKAIMKIANKSFN